MNIIVEGPDRVGKDTVIQAIRSRYLNHPFFVISSSKIDCDLTSNAEKKYYLKYYDRLLSSLESMDALLLNRSHLGELVYGPLYRSYTGEYVLELEKTYDLSKTILILLVDDPRTLAARDDGKSIDSSESAIENEINLFKEAFKKSNNFHKILINCASKGPLQVQDELFKSLDKLMV